MARWPDDIQAIFKLNIGASTASGGTEKSRLNRDFRMIKFALR